MFDHFHLKKHVAGLLSLALISGLLVLAYGNTLGFPFHFDDHPFILENPGVKDWWIPVSQLLFEPFRFQREITLLTFSLNHALGQFQVWGYHSFNVLVHGVNAWLVFGLIRHMLQFHPRWATEAIPERSFQSFPTLLAMVCAALFALHPLMTASVTYLTQRSGLLATLFVLLAMHCYLIAQRKKSTRVLLWVLLAITCLWLAAHCKEMALMALTLPIALELALRFHQPKRCQIVVWMLVPVLGLFLVMAGTHLLAMGLLRFEEGLPALGKSWMWSPLQQLQAKARALFYYYQLFWLPNPEWMSVDHHLTVARARWDWLSLLAVGAHLTIIFLGFFLAHKRYSLAAFGIFWFYLMFFPYVIVPEADILVEYKAYLPSIGMLLIFAELGLALRQRVFFRQQNTRPRPALKNAILLSTMTLLILLSLLARQRNQVYASAEALWMDALRKAPQKARIHHNLGIAYSQQGNYSMALLQFQNSLQLQPGFVLAHLNLARTHAKLNQPSHAIQEYEAVLSLLEQSKVDELRGMQHELRLEMAGLYLNLGKSREARQHLDAVLRQEPSHSDALYLKAKWHVAQNQIKQAVQELSTLEQLRPDWVKVPLAMAMIHYQMLDYPKAIEQLQKALVLEPTHTEAWNNLGTMHSMLGEYEQACADYLSGLQFNPHDEVLRQNLSRLNLIFPCAAAP